MGDMADATGVAGSGRAAGAGGRPALVLLWDIDKTLVENHNRVDLFAATVAELGGSLPAGWELAFDGMTDLQILREYLAAAGLADVDEQRALAVFERLSRDFYTGPAADMRPVPGVEEALDACLERGWVNAVFTGNTPARAPLKLRAAGLDPERYFGGFAHGEDLFQGLRPARLDAAERVLGIWPGSPLLVVGDAQLDYQLAEYLRCRFWQVGHAALATSPEVACGREDDFVGERLGRFLAAAERCAAGAGRRPCGGGAFDSGAASW